MSTHIVDRLEAVRLTAAETGWIEDIYIVAELGGDNNVRNARTGRRARDWSVTAIGPEWSVIGQACRYAAGCSGGMTKLRGRATKPESYIRAYRKALANAALGFQAAAERKLRFTARTRFSADEEQSYQFSQLSKTRTPEKTTWYGEPIKVFHFDLGDPADVRLWLDNRKEVAWHNAEVSGPGTV